MTPDFVSYTILGGYAKTPTIEGLRDPPCYRAQPRQPATQVSPIGKFRSPIETFRGLLCYASHSKPSISTQRSCPMSTYSETFGRLLKGAINSIAAYEGKTAPAVEDQI